MKKSEIIELTMDRGSRVLIRALSHLGTDNVEHNSTDVEPEDLCELIVSGKIPYTKPYQRLYSTIYSHPDILALLQPIAASYLVSMDPKYLRRLCMLMYFGVTKENGEIKFFGSYFYSPGFINNLDRIPCKNYSEALVDQVEMSRQGPNYYLIYDLCPTKEESCSQLQHGLLDQDQPKTP